MDLAVLIKREQPLKSKHPDHIFGANHHVLQALSDIIAERHWINNVTMKNNERIEKTGQPLPQSPTGDFPLERT
jgi:hypothetical protein